MAAPLQVTNDTRGVARRTLRVACRAYQRPLPAVVDSKWRTKH